MSKKLTCREAIKKAIHELEGGPVTARELFNKVKMMGRWSEDTIWQHLMSLVINLPPAYKHWPNIPERFLFLREDGRYELYDPNKHGTYIEGTRVNNHSNIKRDIILKECNSNKLLEKLRSYVESFFTINSITLAEITREFDEIPGIYVFFDEKQAVYVGSTNNLYRRLKHDLWGSLGQPKQPHIFGKKLIEKFDGDRAKAKDYLKRLQLKVIKTDSLGEARVLEQLLICLLRPVYNKETTFTSNLNPQ